MDACSWILDAGNVSVMGGMQVFLLNKSDHWSRGALKGPYKDEYDFRDGAGVHRGSSWPAGGVEGVENPGGASMVFLQAAGGRFLGAGSS